MRVDDRQGAAPDRSRRTEDGESPRRHISAIRRTPVRRTASRRSGRGRRRGPGISAELSFTPALRFSSDSNRSPAMPSPTIASPTSSTQPADRPGSHQRAASASAAGARTKPPIAPSSVFFGLMTGESLWRPNARPVKYCAVSLTTIVSSSSSTASRPARACSATRLPSGRPRYSIGKAAAAASASTPGEGPRAPTINAPRPTSPAASGSSSGSPRPSAAQTRHRRPPARPRAAPARRAPRPGGRTRRRRARAPPSATASSASGGRNQMQLKKTGMRTRPLRMRTMWSLTWRRAPGGAA